MNASNELAGLVEELAAHWTEPTLEILRAAGMSALTVETELESWRIVRDVLRSELRWQRAFRSSIVISLPTLMEQVLQKAAFFVFQKNNPWPVPHEFGAKIRQFAAGWRSTTTERNLYLQIIRQPGMRAAFKAPSRSDFVPRLRLSTVGR